MNENNVTAPIQPQQPPSIKTQLPQDTPNGLGQKGNLLMMLGVIILLLTVGSGVTYYLYQTELSNRTTDSIKQQGGNQTQKLPCPEIAYLQEGDNFLTRFSSFVVSPVFATPPSSPLKSRLCLSEKPLLNKPVTLLYKFKSVFNAPNVTAKMELPDGIVLVSGSPEWKGDLGEKQEQRFDIVVKVTKAGYYQLKGSAFSETEGYKFGDTDTIDLEISQNDAILDSRPENKWYEPTQGQTVPLSENNAQINSQLEISNNPELNKEFTITYRVTPLINIPDPRRTQLDLVFPPKAFQVINVEFPRGGETYNRNGQLTWHGSIKKNQTVEIKATLKVVNPGQGSLYGGLNVQQGGGISQFIQDAKIAELYVDKYTGKFTIK